MHYRKNDSHKKGSDNRAEHLLYKFMFGDYILRFIWFSIQIHCKRESMVAQFNFNAVVLLFTLCLICIRGKLEMNIDTLSLSNLSIVIQFSAQNLQKCTLVGDPHILEFHAQNTLPRSQKHCLNNHNLLILNNSYVLLRSIVTSQHLMVEVCFTNFSNSS